MLATRIVFLGIFCSFHFGLCHITFESVCVLSEQNTNDCLSLSLFIFGTFNESIYFSPSIFHNTIRRVYVCMRVHVCVLNFRRIPIAALFL